ncbi:GNAT family N-acetyltransferase [Lactobacillaceae bacterium Scapto_B20]
MQITFKRPEVDDLDVVLHVEQSCFEPAEQSTADDLKNIITNVSDTSFLAIVDGKVAGMLLGRTTADPLLNNQSYVENLTRKPDDRYLGILGLAVDPEYQGLGIATKLLEQSEQLVQSEGLEALILDCREKLIPFYKKHGFELLGKSNSNFGGIEWFGMQKNLTE